MRAALLTGLSSITPVAMTSRDIDKFTADWRAAVKRGIDAGAAPLFGHLLLLLTELQGSMLSSYMRRTAICECSVFVCS